MEAYVIEKNYIISSASMKDIHIWCFNLEKFLHLGYYQERWCTPPISIYFQTSNTIDSHTFIIIYIYNAHQKLAMHSIQWVWGISWFPRSLKILKLIYQIQNQVWFLWTITVVDGIARKIKKKKKELTIHNWESQLAKKRLKIKESQSSLLLVQVLRKIQ